VNREDAFVIAAAAMLVVSVSVPVVGANGSEATEGEITFDPDVPDVDAFEPPTEDGTATVDGERYGSAGAALDAAEPGDRVVLDGRFDERLVIDTPGVTVTSADANDRAMIDGGGEGDALTIAAEDVTVEGVWIANSGPSADTEDAGVVVDGENAELRDVRITDITFGVWVDGVENVTIADATIAGREGVPTAERGNGIHLWEADGATVEENHVTNVRDGIYYSYSSDVVAEGNTLWELRYGVHYMYSDDNLLRGNVAFDNDVGFALMVSENLTVVDNVAVGNSGTSGHGILVKDIERSEIRGNEVVANGNGLYVYNAQDNAIVENLVLENGVGIHSTAGSGGQEVVGNTVVENDLAAVSTASGQVEWNDDERGNYWGDARTADVTGDGISDVRHQPAGTVERLLHDRPAAAVFAESPAFDAIRLAESSFPAVESSGVVDHRPLAEPTHEDWREYYED
jgi:nitrous oxidase accessory protein